MRKKTNLSAFAACALACLLGATACTEEYEQVSDKETSGSGDPTRREVTLTLRNKLNVAPAGTTKADGIAIASENTIEALDVYVFGAETENGTYTYQERFAYRPAGSPLPSGATPMEVPAPGADNTTRIKLTPKKGLFVRLYCIANQTELVDPSKTKDTTNPDDATKPLTFYDPNEVMKSTDFIGLKATTDVGSNKVRVDVAGIPTEEDFLKYRTRFIDPKAPGDTLAPPLPMTGALTVPIDLTNLGMSGTISTGIRLTRMVARFDIVNDTQASNVVIESVSMNNGRKAATFFPIRSYSSKPDDSKPQPEDLILYPYRRFWGENANAGTCEGGFYCYPSTIADQGHLMLKGYYMTNKSDSIPVTYSIPFRTMAGNNSTNLDIEHNHRYIVNIIDADPYQIKCTMNLADWEDNGQIDDYQPDNTPSELKIDIPDAFPANKYIPDSSLVYMTRGSGSYFNVSVNTNSEITVTKSYDDGSTDKDWLKIEAPTITDNITKALSSKTYMFKVTINSTYDGDEAPGASITFTDKAQGLSSTIYAKRLPSDIKANNITFTAQALKDTTFQITTPGGCTAKVSDWNGGDPWFTLNTPDLSASESEQSIKITQIANLTTTRMRPATILFTNKNKENGDKTITVTPVGAFEAPLAAAVTDTTVYVAKLNNTSNSLKYTVSDSYIGGISITGDTSKVTVSMVNKNITISARNVNEGDNIKIGITNGADTSKVSIVNINNIVVKKYNGEDVWCYGNVFMAATDAATNVTWRNGMSTICPEGWKIPITDEQSAFTGGNPYGTNVAEIQAKKIIEPGVYYWANTFFKNGISFSSPWVARAMLSVIENKMIQSTTDLILVGGSEGDTKETGNVRCISILE